MFLMTVILHVYIINRFKITKLKQDNLLLFFKAFRMKAGTLSIVALCQLYAQRPLLLCK